MLNAIAHIFMAVIATACAIYAFILLYRYL